MGKSHAILRWNVICPCHIHFFCFGDGHGGDGDDDGDGGHDGCDGGGCVDVYGGFGDDLQVYSPFEEKFLQQQQRLMLCSNYAS